MDTTTFDAYKGFLSRRLRSLTAGHAGGPRPAVFQFMVFN